MMNRVAKKRNRAGVLAGLAAATLLTVLGVAVAADTGAEATEAKPVSVCETGFASDPQYRAECMSVGGTKEAAEVWFDGYSPAERDAQCVQAWRTGDLRTVVVETRGDVISDSFTNADDMLNRVVTVGLMECVSNGHDSVDLS